MRHRVRCELIYAVATTVLVLGVAAGLWSCGPSKPRNECFGHRCPSGKRCMPTKEFCEGTTVTECVDEVVAMACDGLAEGALCEHASGGKAYCHQGVCRIPQCGNRYLEPDEDCEICDGGDGCSASCAWEVCGNGVVDPGEECDCGTVDNTHAQSDTCNSNPNNDNAGYCNTECKLNCGDGEIDLDEVCDKSRPVEQYCTDYNNDYDIGHLGCSDNCLVKTNCCVEFDYTAQQFDSRWQMMGLWGTSIKDIYAAGFVCNDTDPLKCWEHGARGAIFHYNGEDWVEVSTALVPVLMDIAGNVQEEFFAVGREGTILHKDGDRWLPITHEVLPLLRDSYHFRSVHVSNEDLVYIAGDDRERSEDAPSAAIIFERNADGQWTDRKFPEIKFLADVWSSEGHVFAVGGSQDGEAVVVHRDNEDWEINYFPEVYGELYGVGGTGANNVIVVGDDGLTMRYAHDEWTIIEPGNSALPRLVAATGLASGKILILGTNTEALFYNNREDPPLSEATALTRSAAFRAVWAHGEKFVAVGERGRFLRYETADYGWSLLADLEIADSYKKAPIKDIWLSETGEILTVVDSMPHSYTIHGHVDHPESLRKQINPQGADIVKIWGTSFDNIYGIKKGGYISENNSGGWLYHWNGSDWRELHLLSRDEALRAIWGFSHGDGITEVFVAGGGGSIFRYRSDLDRWERMNSGVDVNLFGIWGSSTDDIYAVGDEQTILYYDGVTWAPRSLKEGANDSISLKFREVWGLGPEEVFVVGDASGIFHCRSTERDCEEATIPIEFSHLDKIWGRSPSEVYVAGHDGHIYRYDGNMWSPVRFESKTAISDITGNSERRLFASRGSIYELTLPGNLCRTSEDSASDSLESRLMSYP